MKIYLIIICLACRVITAAQVSIGKPVAAASALLDLQSTQKGLLLPRGTQMQRININDPGNSMLYYQLSAPEGLYHYKKGTPSTTWQPLLPYRLQQNLHLRAGRLLGNRVSTGGITFYDSSLMIQTTTPVRIFPFTSPLMVYNGSEWADFAEANLISFKTLFGLNLFSMKFFVLPYNYFGIFQNSTDGPIPRFIINPTSMYLGIPPPDQKHDAESFALRVAGNLKFNGNIEVGVTYEYIDYTLPAHKYNQFDCACSAGKSIVSGGGGARDGGSPQDNVLIRYSGPASANTWRMIVGNHSNSTKVIRLYVICSRLEKDL